MQARQNGNGFWLLVLLGGLLLAVGVLMAIAARRTPVLIKELLAPISGVNTTAHFRMPQASTFHLVLALDKGPSDFNQQTRPIGRIEGEVTISDGTNLVVRLPVEHANLEPCNWLDREGFGVSYALGWQSAKTLPKQLLPGREYRVEARLEGITNSTAAIWMHCAVLAMHRQTAMGMRVTHPNPTPKVAE